MTIGPDESLTEEQREVLNYEADDVIFLAYDRDEGLLHIWKKEDGANEYVGVSREEHPIPREEEMGGRAVIAVDDFRIGAEGEPAGEVLTGAERISFSDDNPNFMYPEKPEDDTPNIRVVLDESRLSLRGVLTQKDSL